MIKNYVLIAFRNLRRQPGYTAVNILGLGIGVASCLLIGLFVMQEYTYDRFHEQADRLYRAWITEVAGEGTGQRTFTTTTTPAILGPTLQETFPEVETAVRVIGFGTGNPVGHAGRRFDESLHFVDPNFFEVFSFRLLKGDPVTAINGPQRVVLTEAAAQRYFPGEDPMGRVLPIDLEGETRDYVVTGVVETPPVASSLQFRMLLPLSDWFALVSGNRLTSWHVASVETYVLARPNASRAQIEQNLPSLVRRVMPENYQGSYSIHLQPMADIHLGTTLPDTQAPVAYRQYLSLLGLIAFFVLAVAAINFVTLSLGQSARRSREVGLRKTLGAQRGQVAAQFWSEALVLTALSLILGVWIAASLAPVFSNLAGVELAFSLNGRTLGVILMLFVFVGICSGAYPAAVLSGFRPIEALKDRLQIAGDRSLLRRGLVVLQFGLAIVLIIGTLFAGRQLAFLRSEPLGLDKDHVVVIPTGMALGDMLRVLDRFRADLSGHASVESVSAAAFAPYDGWARGGYTDVEGVWRTIRINWGAPDFFDLIGVELAAGRMLDENLSTDSMHILVNETLVREYGWGSPENALGRKLPGPDLGAFEIVGVVRDFHFASFRDDIEPLVFTLHPIALFQGLADITYESTPLRKIFVRIDAANVPATIATLGRTWYRAAGDLPFNYYFLDEAVQAQYLQEERLARIASAGSLLAIFIASLGLFALATLSVVRRRKEVGVRRAMGATTAGLVALLSKDFLKLVAVAFFLAAPVAYVGVSRWLESFAYRIEPGAGVFLMTALLVALVAFAAVAYQALRAALTNPVQALRTD